jgi:transposase InsO family protein
MVWLVCKAKVIVKSWRQHYITVRPHSGLDYLPPE